MSSLMSALEFSSLTRYFLFCDFLRTLFFFTFLDLKGLIVWFGNCLGCFLADFFFVEPLFFRDFFLFGVILKPPKEYPVLLSVLDLFLPLYFQYVISGVLISE